MESWYSIRRAGPRCGWHTRLATCKPYCRVYNGRPRRESFSKDLSMCCSRRVSAAWPAASSSAPPSSSLWSKIDSNRPGQHIQLGNTKHRKSHLTHIQAQHVNSNWPCSCSNQFQDPGQSTVVPLVLVRQLAQIWHTIGRTSNAKKMSGKENDKRHSEYKWQPKEADYSNFYYECQRPCSPHNWKY